jgi:hypothetical protein
MLAGLRTISMARLGFVAMALTLFANGASAFDPPVDAAGPLTVRIDGPSEVTHVETPVPVRVMIENGGDAAVRGSVRVGVIDRWRVEPAGPVPFEVSGKGNSQLEFAVVAGEGTYNAHYPIHAFAEFDLDGRRRQAHPILVVGTKLPDPPRPQVPIDWKPVAVPADGGLALAHLPVRRAAVLVFGEKPLVMPVGWSGTEERSRGSVAFDLRIDRGGVRPALGIHPPYYEGHVGTAVVEFPLSLPPGQPVRLRFANAIRDHHPEQGEAPSDGVTFRVRVVPFDAMPGEMGDVLFERYTDAKVWQDGEADLGRFAGQRIRLQLESHPGPQNNTNCDQSYWAEPTVIAGAPPKPAPFPPNDDAASRLIGTLQHHGRRYDVRLWPGRRGLLDAVVGFVDGEKRLMFRGFRLRVLGDALENPFTATSLVDTTEEPSDRGYRLRHHFRSWAGEFDVVGEISTEAAALHAKFRLENVPPSRPWRVAYLEDVAAGPWTGQATRVYAGQGNVVCRPEAFELPFDGHRLSTSFVGFDFANGLAMVQGVDVPPDRLTAEPNAREYTLHSPHTQTLTFIPSANVWEGVQVWREINGLKAAGGVRKLAGRFVFDLWGGRYADSAAALRRAFRYGLTDSAVVWHNWQRWGYDNRLPDIHPPNPKLGSLAEFRDLAKTCKDNGVLFAPHDNYIDYYPDADGYSYDHIAFHADGQPVRAWFNPGPKAQAYRWRTDHIRPVLERNLEWVKENVAPTAYFIDVWSSIGPYDSWTQDGRFQDRVYTRNTWGGFFAWIRDYLGHDAPQISESGHDQLIGWLDGSQTNHLRVDIPSEKHGWMVWPLRCADSERIPWFDAAHHDRFVQHGAGYEGRYCGGLDAKTHGIYSDDYICTEVLTGHPAMVPVPFGRDVVRKYWLTHDLMRALSLHRIEGVEFVDGDIHRQHVRWDNGGEVWVNRGASNWTVAGHTLPQYGFYARVPTAGGVVEAAIERKDNATVEWSRSPTMLYINPRSATAGKAAVFGGISTTGACRITRDGNAVTMTPLPDSVQFAIRLQRRNAQRIEVLDEAGNVVRTESVREDGDALVLTHTPGTFAYRLRP